MILHDKIKTDIENRTGILILKSENLSGGCISNAYKVTSNNGEKFFVKINEHTPPDMFKKEAHGLNELQKAGAIRVPQVTISTEYYLVEEFIEEGTKSGNFFEDFGRNFAQLHKYSGASFGFYEDNYIGSTPQNNLNENNNGWVEFYFTKRLLFQLTLCESNNLATDELRKSFAKLENKISDILTGSEEEPSLLHGDLWSGNYMVDKNGNACLIDPAVYYGHREADIAMTKLFGGYPKEFYATYNESYPLKDGWEYRENIYKLYHVLNHLNLFGRSYYSQALSLIKFYL
jgi:fructosamine-3-kinase